MYDFKTSKNTIFNTSKSQTLFTKHRSHQRMQSSNQPPTAIASNNNIQGASAQPQQQQNMQPVYVQMTHSPTGSYHEYEFVDQTGSPVPPPAATPVLFQQLAAAQGTLDPAKVGYPEVPTPASLREARPIVGRLVRVNVPPPNVLPVPEPQRRGVMKKVLAFVQSLFDDEENLRIEKEIVEEAKRQVELEELIESEQDVIDRQERKEAWERIERLPEEMVRIQAIQAEISRCENHTKRVSERRLERSKQRDSAREELQRFRSQRMLVMELKMLCYGLTAALIFAGAKSACRSVHGKSGKESLTSKVLVAKSTNSGSAPTPSNQSGGSSSAPSGPAAGRRCGW